MTAITLAFLSVTAVGAVSLAGLLTLSMRKERVKRLAGWFVSFAVGALLGDTFIHLVPEIFAAAGRDPLAPSLRILAGILLFFVVEKLLRHPHAVLHLHRHHTGEQPQLAAINILGDAIHNYIDGLLIGASWLASTELGISTTVAVLLHEIPQELADFGVLVHSGLTVRRATLLNIGSAAVAILGTATAVFAGAVANQKVSEALVPITAGGFVYIATADLIPELQRDRRMRALLAQTALISAGIAVMALLAFVD